MKKNNEGDIRLLKRLDFEEQIPKGLISSVAETKALSALHLNFFSVAKARKVNKPKPSDKEILFFWNSLLIFLNSGLNIQEALFFMLQEGNSCSFDACIVQTLNKITNGCSLNESFSGDNEFFQSWMAIIFKKHEKVGNIKEGVQEIATILAWQQDTTKSILKNLRYPLFVGVVVFINTFFIIKNFLPLLEESKNSDPLQNLVLFFLSNLHGFVLFLMLIGLVAGLYFFFHENTLSNNIYFIPILGRIFYTQDLLIFYRNLAICAKDSKYFLEALEIIINYETKTRIIKVAEKMKNKFLNGAKPQEIFEDSFWPSIDKIIILNGWSVNNLAEVFKILAKDKQKQLDEFIDKFKAYFEPTVILSLGFVVLLIVGFILRPIMLNNLRETV